MSIVLSENNFKERSKSSCCDFKKFELRERLRNRVLKEKDESSFSSWSKEIDGKRKVSLFEEFMLWAKVVMVISGKTLVM